jgi:hypothetical protein
MKPDIADRLDNLAGEGWKGVIHMRSLLLILAFIGSAVLAKDVPKDKIVFDQNYICLNNVVAGLEWKSGKWTPSSYHPEGSFQMEIEKVELAGESEFDQVIHISINSDSEKWHCGMHFNIVDRMFDPGEDICYSAGVTISFSEKEERGGISRLIGALSTGDDRDSLTVSPFTCHKQ